MANIKKSAEELIGRTPLMELVNYETVSYTHLDVYKRQGIPF